VSVLDNAGGSWTLSLWSKTLVNVRCGSYGCKARETDTVNSPAFYTDKPEMSKKKGLRLIFVRIGKLLRILEKYRG
jgi:hypothetical protein